MVRKESEIINEISRLAQSLNKNIKVDSVILFGSYAKGTADKDSDVDIAVISPEFGRNPLKDKQLVYRTIVKENIEPYFEIHTFTPSELKNSSNYFISEIRSTGKKIWTDSMLD
ncbi:nucleotidyltransferase domain-containing protein [Desulfolucanica intricata]|uniref:nucleotidyltransferase domain-containing protein n=1 Tax=Desulfolucanica intricata TaxID=1285191 RepID=UPI00082CF3C1|nr:nucleotidyltransferase domain-containing protein [Desulfolucanica intricata]